MKRINRTALDSVVALAAEEGQSYGKYVARMEHPVIVPRKRQWASKKSSWTSPRRTILEGLDCELTHKDTRAEWLDDEIVKEKNLHCSQEAERKVRAFFAEMDEHFSSKRRYTCITEEHEKEIIDLYRRGYSKQSIASIIGCATSSVRKVIREWRESL